MIFLLFFINFFSMFSSDDESPESPGWDTVSRPFIATYDKPLQNITPSSCFASFTKKYFALQQHSWREVPLDTFTKTPFYLKVTVLLRSDYSDCVRTDQDPKNITQVTHFMEGVIIPLDIDNYPDDASAQTDIDKAVVHFTALMEILASSIFLQSAKPMKVLAFGDWHMQNFSWSHYTNPATALTTLRGSSYKGGSLGRGSSYKGGSLGDVSYSSMDNLTIRTSSASNSPLFYRKQSLDPFLTIQLTQIEAELLRFQKTYTDHTNTFIKALAESLAKSSQASYLFNAWDPIVRSKPDCFTASASLQHSIVPAFFQKKYTPSFFFSHRALLCLFDAEFIYEAKRKAIGLEEHLISYSNDLVDARFKKCVEEKHFDYDVSYEFKEKVNDALRFVKERDRSVCTFKGSITGTLLEMSTISIHHKQY